MLKSDFIRKKPSIQAIRKQCPYGCNIPESGFFINGRPALTQIDPAGVGDYVILLVRDALCAYGKDSAEVVADRLERPVCIGRSGMFTSWSGWYKGAQFTTIWSTPTPVRSSGWAAPAAWGTGWSRVISSSRREQCGPRA